MLMRESAPGEGGMGAVNQVSKRWWSRCRVDGRYKLEIHIDTDEGNACDLTNATKVELFR